MTDVFDIGKRSDVMRRIRSKNSLPELRVRKLLHKMGYRFRLHRKDLPGKPDIILPKWRAVVQVHGCFWHGHGCPDGRTPKSNSAYWGPKLAGNKARDALNAEKMAQLGWKQIVVWECETQDLELLAQSLIREIQMDEVTDGCGN